MEPPDRVSGDRADTHQEALVGCHILPVTSGEGAEGFLHLGGDSKEYSLKLLYEFGQSWILS